MREVELVWGNRERRRLWSTGEHMRHLRGELLLLQPVVVIQECRLRMARNSLFSKKKPTIQIFMQYIPFNKHWQVIKKKCFKSHMGQTKQILWLDPACGWASDLQTLV